MRVESHPDQIGDTLVARTTKRNGREESSCDELEMVVSLCIRPESRGRRIIYIYI